MPDVRWIKVVTDIFDDEKIILIEQMPGSSGILLTWFKLLCFAGKQNNGGVFTVAGVPHTAKTLSAIFRMKESEVQRALTTFEQFGMIETVDGVITIPNWGKHQNLDQLESKKAYMQNYMQKYREKQKALASGDYSCKTNSKTNVSQADKEKEREEEIDMSPDGDESTAAPAPYKDIVDLYHTICTSYPVLRTISEKRKQMMDERWAEYKSNLNTFRELFTIAEESPFLKGKNDKGWSADFNWLMDSENMPKVLEGNYSAEFADLPASGRKPAQPENSSFDTDEFMLAALKRSYGQTYGESAHETAG